MPVATNDPAHTRMCRVCQICMPTLYTHTRMSRVCWVRILNLALYLYLWPQMTQHTHMIRVCWIRIPTLECVEFFRSVSYPHCISTLVCLGFVRSVYPHLYVLGLEEITPQYTESNARPRKRTAHGNISRTELPQTQHSLATMVEGPSSRTETPRSQRYSQRVFNQTKRNHDSISTSPTPLPQTAAITCLSDPAPTNQLATLSQDRQAKRARHTQDTLPGTRKGTRSQQKVSNIRP